MLSSTPIKGEEMTNLKDFSRSFDDVDILQEVLPSKVGYLIRPYVHLQGQKKGYMWQKDKDKGFWRAFINSHRKRFTLESTGRRNNANFEAYIGKAYYYGDCDFIDNESNRRILDPYLERRYFKTEQNLPSLLTVTSKYRGTILNIGLDCHEAKFHSRFSSKDNVNIHSHLRNWHEEKRINLQFEIQSFRPEIQMAETFTNKYRNKETSELFRLWSFVSAREIKHIAVAEIQDETGTFFVSDTRFYIPWWLKLDGIPPQSETLPQDQVVSKHIIATSIQRKKYDRKVVNAVREEDRVNDYTGPVTWFSWNYWTSVFHRIRQIFVGSNLENDGTKNPNRGRTHLSSFYRKSISCELADEKNSIWPNQQAEINAITAITNEEEFEKDVVVKPCSASYSTMNLSGSRSEIETSSNSWIEVSDISIPIRRCELSTVSKFYPKSHLRSYDSADLNSLNPNCGRFKLPDRKMFIDSSLNAQIGIGEDITGSEFSDAVEDLGNILSNLIVSEEHKEESLVRSSLTSSNFTNIPFATHNKSRNRIKLSSLNDSSIAFRKWEDAYIAKFWSHTHASVSHKNTVLSSTSLFAKNDSEETITTNKIRSISSVFTDNKENAFPGKQSTIGFSWSDQWDKKTFGKDPLIIDSNIDIKSLAKTINLSSSESCSFTVNENLIVASTLLHHHEASIITNHRAKSCSDINDSIDSPDQNISLRDPDVTLDDQKGENMSISDINIIKKFIDSVLKFEEWNRNTMKDCNYLDELLRDATMKTVIESINLQKKGIAGTQRYVKLCKHLSVNSIEISKTAALARTKYNKEAKKINEARHARIPKLDDNVKASFRNILNSKFLSYASKISKEAHMYFETAAELKKTALYQSMLEVLLKEE